jgi:CheY-like chemotaxis protein
MSGLHILVVDDNELLRRGLSRGLSGPGRTVSTAGSGRDGLELLHRERPDVVFLDVRLPDADGLELLGVIATLSPATRVVVMSADDREETRDRALSGGAFRFLPKPFSLPEAAALLPGC